MRERLAPGALQPVNRRHHDEEHERDLEVQVDDDQSPEAGGGNPVVGQRDAEVHEYLGEDALRADRRDEGEGEPHTTQL